MAPGQMNVISRLARLTQPPQQSRCSVNWTHRLVSLRATGYWLGFIRKEDFSACPMLRCQTCSPRRPRCTRWPDCKFRSKESKNRASISSILSGPTRAASTDIGERTRSIANIPFTACWPWGISRSFLIPNHLPRASQPRMDADFRAQRPANTNFNHGCTRMNRDSHRDEQSLRAVQNDSPDRNAVAAAPKPGPFCFPSVVIRVHPWLKRIVPAHTVLACVQHFAVRICPEVAELCDSLDASVTRGISEGAGIDDSCRCGEMADAQDLKSWGRNRPCRFESDHRHHP